MKEALKLALEALEYWDVHGGLHQPTEEAITALRLAIDVQNMASESTYKAALAQTQEPVAKYSDIVSDGGLDPRNKFDATPQRTWVGLDEKDFSAINQSCLTKLQAATSAESVLKEKNT